MRREPKQARSRAKVEKIIQAAAEILRSNGYEALSTIEVARRANVAIGTLYQFFDDKEDLMEAIAERHLKAIDLFRKEKFGLDAVYVPLTILVDRTVDWLLEYNAANPTFDQILSGTWRDERLINLYKEIVGGFVFDIETVMSHRRPTLSATECRAAAAVLVSMLRGMLGMVRQTDDPELKKEMINKIKQMSLLYLTDLLQSDQNTE